MGQVTAGFGAVLYDPRDQAVEFVEGPIPKLYMDKWTDSGKRQVVGQAEVLPVLLARTTWKARLEERTILLFIDNASARFAVMKGYSPVLDTAEMLYHIWRHEVEDASTTWCARVPSPSNLADGTSKMQDFLLLRLGARRIVAVFPSFGLCGETGGNACTNLPVTVGAGKC